MAWLLIDLGADVNAIDKDGNRPLHLVYSQLATMTDEKELEHFGQFADMLVQSGAHVDVLNNKGESCVELSKSTNFPLDVVAHTSLKCLTARTILDNNISYKGEVPTDVEDWIKFHMKPAT
ncbi:hypothetical protein FSP39_006959 [Pinctada imbricata]|uniref:Uncharacterized protein n=1 Tax=Pinctada imbricata TaxID=66713 RepID=A0AA89BQR2_PINIB|nr:hypothetical protein FSP39_006959 [Pinctada imbricata]